MFGTNERFDLTRAVFSRENSCIAFYEEYSGGGLYLTFSRVSPWFVLERRALVRLVPLFNGKNIDYSYRATPTELVIETRAGKLEICIAESELIRIRGSEGTGLRLVVEPEYNDCLCPVDYGCIDINLGLHGKMLVVPLRGSASGYAPWNNQADQPCYLVADLMPDSFGVLETAIHCVTREIVRREIYAQYDVAKAEVDHQFETFCKKFPPVEEKYREMALYAMYTIWSHRMGPSEHSVIQSPIVQMHRLWLSHGFAWQQSYNAMAIRNDPEEAWRLIKSMFEYQLGSGMLPDWVDFYSVNYLACKPAIQGFALAFLLEHADMDGVLTSEECGRMYEPFCRWADFWLKYRASDREGVLVYHHADESGWDEATIFSKGLPVEAPDLMAFVILLMEACARLALGCGRSDEAGEWMRRSRVMLKRLTEEFWDGKQFNARLAKTGEIVPSRSIACYQPIILGKRLPQDIIDTIAEALTDEKEYLSPIGLTSEAMTSPECTYSYLFMKGRVVAPVQMIFCVGLQSAGKTGEAKRIARAFCDKVNQEGMILGYAPSEIEPATGRPVENHPFPTPTDPFPWSSWTAANFLILASTILYGDD